MSEADPDVWALLGKRAGDNRQILTLAEASGLSWRPIQLRFDPERDVTPPPRTGSLDALLDEARGEFAPPWPKVAIAAGRRAAPIALWIKARSQGAVQLVHVGRPWAPLAWFDLIVTTPQYGLPERPNVLRNLMPLTRDPGASEAETPPDLAAMPRPRLVVVAGGDSAPLVLDARAARRLAATALSRARSAGGSLLVVTSPRTSPAATQALREALASAPNPVLLAPFGEGENRYAQLLAAADAFLVTDDSASMATEAAMTGAPVELFRLPERVDVKRWSVKRAQRMASKVPSARAIFERAVASGALTANRDLSLFMAGMAEAGLLVGGRAARDRAAAELAETAARLRTLAAAAAN